MMKTDQDSSSIAYPDTLKLTGCPSSMSRLTRGRSLGPRVIKWKNAAERHRIRSVVPTSQAPGPYRREAVVVEAVAAIVKRYAGAAGLDVAHVAAHSLRSGLATSSAAAGASERAIKNQTGHRSLITVRRYIRDGSLFRENAAAVVGL